MLISIVIGRFAVYFARTYYDIKIDGFVPDAFHVRVGDYVWSRKKGLRDLRVCS